MSSCPRISIKFIIKHPQFPWEFTSISCRKDVTFELLLHFPDEHWETGIVYFTLLEKYGRSFIDKHPEIIQILFKL